MNFPEYALAIEESIGINWMEKEQDSASAPTIPLPAPVPTCVLLGT